MNIKNTVGIISCKGGVGKSTVAVNFAVWLAFFKDKTVGLLDADLYGPNHPRMLGIVKYKKLMIENNSFLPFKRFNLLSMSLGYFLESNSSVLLRGPMLSNTVNFLFKNTKWGENLDYLIVDFPPGTGDIYLSLLRDFQFNDVILVTTPQLVSIDDLRRSITMLKKFGINVLCILENMTAYTCEMCNHTVSLYGDSNISENFMGYQVLKMPLYSFVSHSTNLGLPFVLSHYDSRPANIIKSLFNFL